MRVRIDLHTHSAMSDGTTSPAELVRAAAEAGLDVVALTDHDTTAGWAEAAEEATRVGIGFVPGAEFSTKQGDTGVHLLGYLFDPGDERLLAEARRIFDGRGRRLAGILAGLAEAEMMLTEDEVRRHAGSEGVIGRPHVADALVARGYARDRREAIETFLSPGRPGFVRRYAPSTADMIGIVNAAGGAAVIAHPWGRGRRGALEPETIADLAAAGLAGLEVDHQDHQPEHRETLRALAAELDLIATGSSDHHGLGKIDHELGCHLTDPEQFLRLLARAAEHAAASGRSVPAMVQPDPTRRRTRA